jgi:DNA polymerase-3 subunit beta
MCALANHTIEQKDIKMKRKEFQNNLNIANKLVKTRNTLPILSYVLLQASDDVLKITCSDLETWLIKSMHYDQSGAWSCAVPLKQLITIIKSLTDDRLVMSHKDNVLTVNGINIPSISSDEYPMIPAIYGDVIETSIDFSELTFLNYAASTDQTRYHLNSVYFDLMPNELNAVATDGHRLALKKVPFSISTPVGLNLASTSVDLIDVAFHESTSVSISYDFVQIKNEDTTLICKRVDGKYPNYSQFIPDKFINKVELLALCKSILPLCSKKIPTVKLQITHNLITIYAMGDIQFKNAVLCDYSGEGLDIGVNVKYLLDALNNTPDAYIKIELNDKHSPIKITSNNVTSIVMPTRL